MFKIVINESFDPLTSSHSHIVSHSAIRRRKQRSTGQHTGRHTWLKQATAYIHCPNRRPRPHLAQAAACFGKCVLLGLTRGFLLGCCSRCGRTRACPAPPACNEMLQQNVCRLMIDICRLVGGRGRLSMAEPPRAPPRPPVKLTTRHVPYVGEVVYVVVLMRAMVYMMVCIDGLHPRVTASSKPHRVEVGGGGYNNIHQVKGQCQQTRIACCHFTAASLAVHSTRRRHISCHS